MAGDAYQVIEKFWKNQDTGDYTTTEHLFAEDALFVDPIYCLLYTSPSPRDSRKSRMPSSA